MKRIALATGAKLPPLRELGVTAVPAVWDSPDVCWEEFQGVVVRSCWDYHHRLEEFLGWVVRLERAGIPVWNPPAVLRWNSHKGYLRDLAARGVPIVPTRWLGRGEPVDLPMLLEDAGWRDAVMKPAVSASASGTWRTSTEAAAGDQARLGGDHGATAHAGRGCRGGHGGGAGGSGVRPRRRRGARRAPRLDGARADRAASVPRLACGRGDATGGVDRRLSHSPLSRNATT